ncbi:MAG: pyridoxal-phosphate dependent enzyme [Candidatus Diapherotrites archaeon]|nr:pyridoxal-phosphate dependent enzyme [Candidatus Diapherotrites archaeon]
MVEIPTHWYNVIPFLRDELGLDIPPLRDPKTNNKMSLADLRTILPNELAKQELGVGEYSTKSLICIPHPIRKLYAKWRPTPVIRAHKLEKCLSLNTVRIFYKREDKSPINSYKLNSSFAQAYYAKKEGVTEFIGDTGPGNWGLGMALACKTFNLSCTIYMERKNYERHLDKVRHMKQLGATVVPIYTKKGTIAASLSKAIQHVSKNKTNKLSLGCLTVYSALHNTVIGQELKLQLRKLKIEPDALVGVVGGGSSFSGFVFPLMKNYLGKTDFIAVESAEVPSFTRGKYRYENPDLLGLMPRTKMYTLGNQFEPRKLGASGLNYHGKNHLLSLLVHEKYIKAVSFNPKEVDYLQRLFYEVEGIRPAAESCYAIKGAIEKAKQWDGQDKTIVLSLTGNAEPLGFQAFPLRA